MANLCPKCHNELRENYEYCVFCGAKVTQAEPTKIDLLYAKHKAVMSEISSVIKGKDDIIEKVLVAIYGSGNILLEDNPGTGKTTLAKTISKAIDLEYRRQQFTPDTMPTDIVGYTFYDKDTKESRYMPGVIQCNLLLADEINRTSAKTQSALLEAMEEKNVTIDGETMALPKPFFVIATQNPNTSMGTQPLPDSQCDRFIVRISMGYPDPKSEQEILKNRTLKDATSDVREVITRDDLIGICDFVDGIYANDDILDYICRLVAETRNNQDIDVGVSPRGTIAIKRLSCAKAFVSGRDYVTPKDVFDVFIDACNHRIILSDRARMADRTEKDVLIDILKKIKPANIVRR